MECGYLPFSFLSFFTSQRRTADHIILHKPSVHEVLLQFQTLLRTLEPFTKHISTITLEYPPLNP